MNVATPIEVGAAIRPDDKDRRHGIAEDLRLLAALHGREPTSALLDSIERSTAARLFAFGPTGERAQLALQFFDQAVKETGRDAEALDELAADHASIYLTHGHRASPCESPWVDPEGLIAQETMFSVREWYQHYGLRVPDWRLMADDHLVHQLLFLAHLFSLDDRPHALADAGRFLDRHLLRWFPHFADAVTARCWTAYWAGLAQVTDAWLEDLRTYLVAATGVPREEQEPIEIEKQRRQNDSIKGESCGTMVYNTDAPPGW